MHSHERTLLAKFGFNDQDRKDTQHDLACRYLSEKDQALKIGKLLFSPPAAGNEVDFYSDTWRYKAYYKKLWLCLKKSRVEMPISKGTGQYQTTIGFMDVNLHMNCVAEVAGKRCERSYNIDYRKEEVWQPYQEDRVVAEYFARIEVKANPIATSESIRQINLYREFVSGGEWVLATLYPLSQGDSDLLKTQKIAPIFLGKSFQDWVELQPKGPADIPEI